MNRTLVIARHTKSSWKEIGMLDFDRPLKKDRINDAENISTKLKSLGLTPDLILSSPAMRTKQTAEIFCRNLNYDFQNVQFDKRIYEASVEDVLKTIEQADAEVKTLLLIGHNPSLTDFVNCFLEATIENLPTTGVVWFDLETDDWNLDKTTRMNFKFFLTPKTI